MSTILTPLEFSGTQTLSRRLFRKKVLPIDSISYNGRKIDFTREYLNNIVESFNNGAYDNVPLQFADADNKHTNDPTRYNGDVVDMSLEDDGLYVTVAATSEGAKFLEENPKLGISARIVNEYDRSDGKHFPAAMQHVLATHDPRIPGLGPWSSVENYSNDDQDDILDLTAEKFDKPKKPKKGKSVAKKDDGLSDAELLKLRSLLADLDEVDEGDEDGSGDNDDVTDELSEDELNALLAEVEAELEAENESEPVDPETREPVSAGAELSNDNEALELANQTALELSQVKAELAETRWKTEREMFMRNYGIPPALLDLAAPVLKSEGQTVELSNGESSDSSAIMRQVLTEFGKLTKVLDLGNEMGSSAEGETDETAEAAARRDETTKALRAMMGN